MAKKTLKVKVQDPFFQYQLRVAQDACLVQIWLIPAHIYQELSCRQTDGQASAENLYTGFDEASCTRIAAVYFFLSWCLHFSCIGVCYRRPLDMYDDGKLV